MVLVEGQAEFIEHMNLVVAVPRWGGLFASVNSAWLPKHGMHFRNRWRRLNTEPIDAGLWWLRRDCNRDWETTLA
jgi:hypothetical protein